jgi:hypothetical protein
MITIYEEDNTLDSNGKDILKTLENKKRIESYSKVVEAEDSNTKIWINPIFKDNPVVKKTFLFVNNVFERNYVKNSTYTLTGMLTGIVSTMGFVVKDPKFIKTLQDIAT